MDHSDSSEARRARLFQRIGPLAIIALCLAGHVDRLRYPSLFYDDIGRVGDLQNLPFGKILLCPFNEHVAPFFQVVSWVTWQAAGHRLRNAPLAFTVASSIPFVLCVVLMMRLVRRETASATTAWLATAVFSISWLHAETVYWYSACSFMLALMWTQVAWLGVVSALNGSPRRGWSTAVLASMLAPACSGIGLLAGPVTALRALADTAPRRRWDRARGVLPLGGTLLYLCFYAWVITYGNPAMRHQIRQEINPPMDLVAAMARGTVGYLVPGLFGLHQHQASRAVELILFGMFLVLALFWSRRSTQRPLILCGLALIVGGYLLTYGVRAGYGVSLVNVERYHLFPQFGLALLLVPLLRAGMARCASRPGLAPTVAIALVALMLATHWSEMRTRARLYHYSDQMQTLAALDRLAATCREKQITRAQVHAVLCPLRPRWSAPGLDRPGYDPLRMFPITVPTPGVSEDRVRSVLLASMTRADRYLICGRMNATRLLVPLEGIKATDSEVVGKLVAWQQVDVEGLERYRVQSFLGFLEYDLNGTPGAAADRPPARYLVVPGKGPLNVMEVWWAGDGHPWSPGRSLIWFPDPAQTAREWAIPLDRLPNWNPSEAQRLRVVFRFPGKVALESPRLLR